MRTTFLLAIISFLAACQTKTEKSTRNESADPAEVSTSFSPEVRYALHFTLEKYQDFKLLVVHNPWDEGDTLVSYVLYPKGAETPYMRKADFTIPVPVEEVVAMSSPHVGSIGLLHELDKIVGVADARYIYNSYLYGQVITDQVAQVGSLEDSNLEVLLDLSPDLVMKTGFDKVRNEDARLFEAGIPITYHLEWMEKTLLARAEWIKFVGAFFNQDERADSIFNVVERHYLKALSIAADVSYRPAIMTGNNYQGTWYMPGSDSYLTRLIADAGGDYHYKNETSKGSLPLSFEVVLDDLIDADYWIGPKAQSLKELEMMDERYTLFKAFRDGNVYTSNKRMSENGGNDYWETGMARPDLILKDAIKIFHPELLPDYELFYYKKLK